MVCWEMQQHNVFCFFSIVDIHDVSVQNDLFLDLVILFHEN